MKKIHYSWVICICCSLVFLCSVGLTTSGFSVFLPYIRDIIGLTNSQTSLIVTIRQIASALGIIFVPKVLGKLGPGRCIIYSTLFLALAFFTYGFSTSLGMFIVGSFMAGFGYGFGGTISVSCIINNWFESKKAFATSVCLAGSGLAPVIFSPIITSIVENYSLRKAFFFIGFFIFLVFAICLFLIKSNPSDLGLSPYRAKEEKSKDITFGEGLPKKIFFIGLIGFFFNGLCGNTCSLYLASIYRSVGQDPYIVSLIASAYGLCAFFSKFIYGAAADKKGNGFSFRLFQVLLMIGASLNILAWTKIVPLAFAAKMIEGIGIPTCTVGISLAAIDFSSKENYVSRLSNIQLANTIGGILSGIIAGSLADTFKSFIPVSIAETSYAVLAGIFICIAYAKVPKKKI